jgi:hypothetical protein
MRRVKVLMNKTPLEVNSPEQKSPAPRLTEPHFDETAIATAQPVEPLPISGIDGQPSKFGALTQYFKQYLSTTAIVLIAIVVISSFAFAFVRSAFNSRTSEIAQETSREPAPEPIIEVPAEAISVNRNRPARRTKLRTIRTNVSDNTSAPVARKVGEIVYRPSPDDQ